MWSCLRARLVEDAFMFGLLILGVSKAMIWWPHFDVCLFLSCLVYCFPFQALMLLLLWSPCIGIEETFGILPAYISKGSSRLSVCSRWL